MHAVPARRPATGGLTRAEGIGVGVAALAHLALFAALSLGVGEKREDRTFNAQPVDVSLVDAVTLEDTAPAATEAPAESIAPEEGLPEDAAPAPAEPQPQPEPVPPQPATQPKAAPEPQPAPAPKPQPAPRPAPKAPPKPAPKAEPKAAPKAAEKAPARPAPAAKAAPKAAAKGGGSDAAAKATRPRGSRLGDDFAKSLAQAARPGQGQAPRAANVGAQSLAGLASAIQRQVQPCANRITNPGPGANQIRSRIRLQLDRDGTMAARPQLRGQTGVDDENQRYAQRVGELAIAALIQCAPYELPADLYDGGWEDIIINYKLPG